MKPTLEIILNDISLFIKDKHSKKEWNLIVWFGLMM